MVVQLEAVFLPADPPRAGRLALFAASEDFAGTPEARIELVLPAGDRVRRRRVPARLVELPEALELLTGSQQAMGSDSMRAWSAAALTGLGLIARGRLLPMRTPDGYGGWRVGPLDPDDHAWLDSLAAAMPPEAHALPIDGTRPQRIHEPRDLVRRFWDGLADTLVRSPAAPLVGSAAFAAVEPVELDGPAEWLAEQSESAARLVLRVEPPEADEDEFRAVFQLRSSTDRSLLLDVAELWQQPAAVLQALGAQAETDLLLALRRGARVWSPLDRALRTTAPTELPVADDELEQLITDGGTLEDAGIEVLWPRDLFTSDLKLRATATPTPGAVTSPDFSLGELLSFSWQPTLDGVTLTEAEIAALAEAKRPVIRMRGRWIRVDQELVAKLRRRARRRLTGVEALAAALTGELEVDGELVDFRTDDRLADLADRLQLGTSALDLEQPAGLEATLRDYQRRGVAWMNHLADIGLGGCLADDMGLGKTIQVIALHLHRASDQPTLVVCPSSLLGTWEREISRFAPDVPKRRYHGGGRSLDALQPGEVVLTTYGVVRQDHRILAGTEFGLAVADEAQHAKNPLSRTAHALRNLNAATRLALTGTPVENRLSELWSILDWATPGLLGPLQRFRHEVAVPVERYQDPDATQRLAKLTRPFLLRRRKSDPGIAPELPPKTEQDVIVGLTTEQGTLYQAVVNETMAKIQGSEGIARQGLVLGLLTQLKQICNHPAQFLKEPGPLPRRSGKLAALDELLDVIIAEGESVLIFSQYVEMCRLIESHLKARSVPTLFLHGGAGVRQREQMVADFQAGAAPVFLLSLKAGGVGLTLTRATHVVHYDRWWNPAVEDQATDRAYRIGQDKPVQVHRLVTEHTLEDRIASVIETKRALAASVIGSAEAWIGDLSDTDLADLVRLGGPTPTTTSTPDPTSGPTGSTSGPTGSTSGTSGRPADDSEVGGEPDD